MLTFRKRYLYIFCALIIQNSLVWAFPSNPSDVTKLFQDTQDTFSLLNRYKNKQSIGDANTDNEHHADVEGVQYNYSNYVRYKPISEKDANANITCSEAVKKQMASRDPLFLFYSKKGAKEFVSDGYHYFYVDDQMRFKDGQNLMEGFGDREFQILSGGRTFFTVKSKQDFISPLFLYAMKFEYTIDFASIFDVLNDKGEKLCEVQVITTYEPTIDLAHPKSSQSAMSSQAAKPDAGCRSNSSNLFFILGILLALLFFRMHRKVKI